MIPWIQVYSNLIQHPKTTNLADELGLSSKDVGPNIVAAGMLVSLWLWAAQNATNGDLNGCSDRSIAEAAGYKKKPAAFVAALIKTKFLDADRKLHDWDEYATLLIDSIERSKQQTRERVKKHREQKKAQEKQDGNGNVTPECNVTQRYNSDGVTLCNAPTVPNLTVPNLTLPNQDIFTGAAGGDRAGARVASESELLSIGIKPGEYPSIHQDRVRWTQAVAKDLFAKYRPGSTPAPWDCRKVFELAYRPELREILDYAFEQAALIGKANDWRYIEGVMHRLHDRGIETVAQARSFDADRPDLEGDL